MLVELANHSFGQCLSQLFLVGVLDQPVTALGGTERVRRVGHERVGAAVFDHLAEQPQQLSAV